MGWHANRLAAVDPAPSLPERAAHLAITAVTIVLVVWSSTAAAQNADADRLREALRRTTTQLRSLEDRQAELQARASESEQRAATLQAKLEAANAEVNTLTEKLDKSQERLVSAGSHISAQNDAITRLDESLAKWRKAYDEAVNVARAKETERARLATELAAFTERATTCEAKNVELFKIGNEILERYKEVGFGDVLARHEPFIGLKRVELQNLVQDYRDELLDQKVVP